MEQVITLDDQEETIRVLGPRDQNVRAIREALGIKIIPRENTLHLEGPDVPVSLGERVIAQLRQMAAQGPLQPGDVQTVLNLVQRSDDKQSPEKITLDQAGRNVRPRTDGQARYVRAMKDHDVTLCAGPAGTGKTYLAVAMAVNALKQGQIKRIVLCRPAVEAGERLGFLPGDIAAKVNPYLRPLLDALEDMMTHDQVKRCMESDVIEICPLAYMRGRTLNQAVIILDEGQNTTLPQMRMFLTRMGMGSKVVVTGDITQVDLPRQTRSGMIDAVERLRNIDGIAVIHLSEADIVRHALVQRIVAAYEETEGPRRGRRR
jgi:phosphate starvation-inducible PhoH-like protein